MKNIEIAILNPDVIKDAEKIAVAAARLTQRSEKISNLADFITMYNKPYTKKLLMTLCDLPHPTLQKLAAINIVVVGASRRFLAQVTRHQNDVHFISGSLQYSDYSGYSAFVVPYTCTELDALHSGHAQFVENYHTTQYNNSCKAAMRDYEKSIENGLSNDDAGYMSPQGLRNVLIISATPFQIMHMIGQRICRRNTAETQYIFLKLWELLWPLSAMFRRSSCFCLSGGCKEGSMSCKRPFKSMHPTVLLDTLFPIIRQESEEVWEISQYPKYEASTKGRIRNMTTQQVLKPALNTSGYPQVCIMHEGVQLTRTVHSLVANTFLVGSGESVNHISQDKTNSAPANLEWLSIGDNIRYSQAKAVESITEAGEVTTYASVSEACTSLSRQVSGVISKAIRTGDKCYGLYWRYVKGEEQ